MEFSIEGAMTRRREGEGEREREINSRVVSQVIRWIRKEGEKEALEEYEEKKKYKEQDVIRVI